MMMAYMNQTECVTTAPPGNFHGDEFEFLLLNQLIDYAGQ